MYLISWFGPAVTTQWIIALRICYQFGRLSKVFFTMEHCGENFLGVMVPADCSRLEWIELDHAEY